MIKLSEYNNAEINDSLYTKDNLKDILRLQKQLLEELNLLANVDECINIWERYSNDLSASWLFFPDNDSDILKEIMSSDFFTSFEDYCE